MKVTNRSRPILAQAAAVASQLAWLPRLPPRVALFYVRALLRTVRTRDEWTATVVTRPRELSALLAAAGSHRVAVEVGTASAWTTAALALAEPGRRVVSFDPEARPQRERYLALLPAAVRERISLVQARGEAGPGAVAGDGLRDVGVLFLDGDHSRESNVATLRTWLPVLAGDAVVAFHDYGDPAYPGVEEAVRELGVPGSAHGTVFIGRRPPTP